MPISIQRLNARHLPPTPHIIFIKPLPGPTSAHATEFLSRVAAISHPILSTHHLSIMSLEEYEPNPEFIGRNFNAGEVIQLVLRTRGGGWMDFKSVVMVMMHELAHCVQMNHSGAFWKVRNGFAGEMRGLWARGYTGEGVWGRGRGLESGEFERGAGVRAEEMPRSLCGGTYRSGRGRKRKRRGEDAGEKLSYAERQQRRIRKKFGVNGVTLGDDEETRVKLEEGRKVKAKGKPRVAGSNRGRELRAAAALARFGQQQEVVKKEEDDGDSGSETESDYEEPGVKKEEARDLDVSKLLDSKGHGMIKVCEDEDADDVHVKEEMQELQDINDIAPNSDSNPDVPLSVKKEPSMTSPNEDLVQRDSASPKKLPSASKNRPKATTTLQQQPPTAFKCPICSTDNEPSALLCATCSHVLDVRKMPGHWRCKSSTCNESSYINSADSGLCGACGSRKPDD